jgi:hypothetical protein
MAKFGEKNIRGRKMKSTKLFLTLLFSTQIFSVNDHDEEYYQKDFTEYSSTQQLTGPETLRLTEPRSILDRKYSNIQERLADLSPNIVDQTENLIIFQHFLVGLNSQSSPVLKLDGPKIFYSLLARFRVLKLLSIQDLSFRHTLKCEQTQDFKNKSYKYFLNCAKLDAASNPNAADLTDISEVKDIYDESLKSSLEQMPKLKTIIIFGSIEDDAEFDTDGDFEHYMMSQAEIDCEKDHLGLDNSEEGIKKQKDRMMPRHLMSAEDRLRLNISQKEIERSRQLSNDRSYINWHTKYCEKKYYVQKFRTVLRNTLNSAGFIATKNGTWVRQKNINISL